MKIINKFYSYFLNLIKFDFYLHQNYNEFYSFYHLKNFKNLQMEEKENGINSNCLKIDEKTDPSFLFNDIGRR